MAVSCRPRRRAPKRSAIASARLAQLALAAQLDQRDLDLDRLLAAVVGHEHDVDQLAELLEDLIDVLGRAAAHDRHAREALRGARADRETLDVVAAAREHQRDAHEHARAVAA